MTLQQHFFDALDHSQVRTTPYRHWLLSDVLPDEIAQGIADLPMTPAEIDDTKGKRETHNSTRIFFSVANRRRFDVCEKVAAMFQDEATVRKLEQVCGIDLKGTYLRIEYCQDTSGFWLEPHTDIGAKLITLLVYLSTDPDSAEWGTTIYDQNKTPVANAPAPFDSALMFVPAQDTWHGFAPRKIRGVRKSIIINYVVDEWRSRHELAYPDQLIGCSAPRHARADRFTGTIPDSRHP